MPHFISDIHFSDQWQEDVKEVSNGSQDVVAVADSEEVKRTANYIAAVYIWTVAAPLLLVFGTATNLATIFVLGRVHRGGGSSTLRLHLLGLAVADLCLLWCGLLRQWVKYAFDVDVRDLSPGWCKLHLWTVYTAGVVSAWMLVVVTAQRVLSVAWPHRVGLLCQTRNAATVILLLVGLAALLHGHFLYGMELLSDHQPPPSASVADAGPSLPWTEEEEGEATAAAAAAAAALWTDPAAEGAARAQPWLQQGDELGSALGDSRQGEDVETKTDNAEPDQDIFDLHMPHLLQSLQPVEGGTYSCRPSESYRSFYLLVWPVVDLVMASIAPFLLLLACNLCLIHRIRGSVRKFERLNEGAEAAQPHHHYGPTRKKVASSLTFSLTALTLTFLVLTLPVHVHLTWYYDQPEEVDADAAGRSELIFVLTSLMWYSNSAINFFLYCLSGTKFRKEFRRWLLCAEASRACEQAHYHGNWCGDHLGNWCRQLPRWQGRLAGRLRRPPEQQEEEILKDNAPQPVLRASLMSPLFCAACPAPNSLISVARLDPEQSNTSEEPFIATTLRRQ